MGRSRNVIAQAHSLRGPAGSGYHRLADGLSAREEIEEQLEEAMEREPCPVCDQTRCCGRCPANQRAVETLRRLREVVEGLEDGSITQSVIFGLAERTYLFGVSVKEVLDETTVGVLFEPPDKVRYLKKREQVGAEVPDHFVEDEHE